MTLSDDFRYSQFQQFDPSMNIEEREEYIREIIDMMENTGHEAIYTVNDEGITFGFSNIHNANTFRLNLFTLNGDTGGHTHTQRFTDPAFQKEWQDLASTLGVQLGIPFDGYEFDGRLEMDFERSTDAVILCMAVEDAREHGLDHALKVAQGRQNQRDVLHADLHGPEPGLFSPLHQLG